MLLALNLLIHFLLSFHKPLRDMSRHVLSISTAYTLAQSSCVILTIVLKHYQNGEWSHLLMDPINKSDSVVYDRHHTFPQTVYVPKYPVR